MLAGARRLPRQVVLSARALSALLAMVALSPGAALAAPDAPRYEILGPGATSCADWASQRQLPDHALALANQGWVLGYVTAYNEYLASDGNVAAGADSDAIAAWIDTYCAAHPLDDLAHAARALVEDLRARKP
jgi:hypothetical protein